MCLASKRNVHQKWRVPLDFLDTSRERRWKNYKFGVNEKPERDRKKTSEGWGEQCLFVVVFLSLLFFSFYCFVRRESNEFTHVNVDSLSNTRKMFLKRKKIVFLAKIAHEKMEESLLETPPTFKLPLFKSPPRPIYKLERRKWMLVKES